MMHDMQAQVVEWLSSDRRVGSITNPPVYGQDTEPHIAPNTAS